MANTNEELASDYINLEIKTEIKEEIEIFDEMAHLDSESTSSLLESDASKPQTLTVQKLVTVKEDCDEICENIEVCDGQPDILLPFKEQTPVCINSPSNVVGGVKEEESRIESQASSAVCEPTREASCDPALRGVRATAHMLRTSPVHSPSCPRGVGATPIQLSAATPCAAKHRIPLKSRRVSKKRVTFIEDNYFLNKAKALRRRRRRMLNGAVMQRLLSALIRIASNYKAQMKAINKLKDMIDKVIVPKRAE